MGRPQVMEDTMDVRMIYVIMFGHLYQDDDDVRGVCHL
jgi:hypothetical protein